MSSSTDTLRFCFPTHGDSILSKINSLREEQRFCDITLLLGRPQGPTVPLHFHGHRAVLAASSNFLRDQFLLHEGRELSLGVVSSVEVGKRLLLSCYTGLLEVQYNLLNYILNVRMNKIKSNNTKMEIRNTHIDNNQRVGVNVCDMKVKDE